MTTPLELAEITKCVSREDMGILSENDAKRALLDPHMFLPAELVDQALAGDAEAIFDIGAFHMMVDSKIVGQERSEGYSYARGLFEAAAKRGHAGGMNNYGVALLTCCEPEEDELADENKAARLFLDAIRISSLPEAVCNMGRLFFKRAKKQTPIIHAGFLEFAEDYLRLAAETGLPEARINLSALLRNSEKEDVRKEGIKIASNLMSDPIAEEDLMFDLVFVSISSCRRGEDHTRQLTHKEALRLMSHTATVKSERAAAILETLKSKPPAALGHHPALLTAPSVS